MPEKFTWYDPTGTPRVLADVDLEEWKVLMGIRGLYLPRVTIVRDQVPGVAGSRVRLARTEERSIDLPLIVVQPTEAQLRARIRELATWFNPDAGQGVPRRGYLHVRGPGGDTRRIQAIYSSGLDGPGQQDTFGWQWQKFVISLLAEKPFFEDADETVETFGGAAPVNFFPIGGQGAGVSFIKLSPSSLLAGRVVSNTGVTNTYPVFEIAGPLTSAQVTNTTTGLSWLLTTTLLATDIVTVNTETFSVRNQAGVNLYGSLSPTSVLWPLVPGNNDIALTLAGTTAATKITIRYRRQYLTA